MKTSAYVVTSLALATLLLGGSSGALATCNVIPAADRRFPSTLGEVTTPFARPNDTVSVRREADVFAADPADNHVSICFGPRGGLCRVTVTDVHVLTPVTGCAPPRCVRFAFPDTDDRVGTGDDRHTLTGPVRITIASSDQITAVIDTLFSPNAGHLRPDR